MALLPVTETRMPTGDPALFQITQKWSGTQASIGGSLDLSALPGGSERVLLVVYTFAAAGPVSELKDLCLQVELSLDLRNNGGSAIVIGEFYRRNDQWKFCALAEGSSYGLAAMGRRMGINIDDAHPTRRPYSGDEPRNRGSAMGTGFTVSPSHVIEDMQELHASSFAGRYRAKVVVVDQHNDIVLLRIQDCPRLSNRGSGGGGLHVTQGGVSGLFGVHMPVCCNSPQRFSLALAVARCLIPVVGSSPW